MTMLAAMMGGGGSASVDIPCAYCAYSNERRRVDGLELLEENKPATLVRGTLVCRFHIGAALAGDDRSRL